MEQPLTGRARVADWFGLNRATVAVLVVIGCLGLSEEVWSNFLSIYLKDRADAVHAFNSVATAALYTGLIAFGKNLLEGFGYIIGGTVAHRMGARVALGVSAIPMSIGFITMLVTGNPNAILFAALLMTNWEPLSVPATFDVVGSEVPKNRRTIAFAVQSIQKRLPKVIGPVIGATAFVAIGYWANLTIAFGLVGVSVILQLALTRRMKPKAEGAHIPFRQILRDMPRSLRLLLTAEIFIRWGDWFARDFAGLYVLMILMQRFGWTEPDGKWMVGWLLAIMSGTALLTYVPVAKWVDRAPSPKPFIGTTFLLFSLFPITLVVLPRLAGNFGLPVAGALILVYVINGLREIGEPARKALISMGFPPHVRARAVGLYWGLRSFAFCPAPLVASYLWLKIGPDATFVVGGVIGLVGTLWYVISNRLVAAAAPASPTSPLA